MLRERHFRRARPHGCESHKQAEMEKWHQAWCELGVTLLVLSGIWEPHMAPSDTHAHNWNTHVSQSLLKSLLNPVAKNVGLCCLFNVYLFVSSAGLCGYSWWWACVVALDGMWVSTLTWSHVFHLHVNIWTCDAFLVTFTVLSFLLATDVGKMKIRFTNFFYFIFLPIYRRKVDQSYFFFFRSLMFLFWFIYFFKRNFTNRESNSPFVSFRTSKSNYFFMYSNYMSYLFFF